MTSDPFHFTPVEFSPPKVKTEQPHHVDFKVVKLPMEVYIVKIHLYIFKTYQMVSERGLFIGKIRWCEICALNETEASAQILVLVK